jgi:hypothetical protein
MYQCDHDSEKAQTRPLPLSNPATRGQTRPAPTLRTLGFYRSGHSSVGRPPLHLHPPPHRGRGRLLGDRADIEPDDRGGRGGRGHGGIIGMGRRAAQGVRLIGRRQCRLTDGHGPVRQIVALSRSRNRDLEWAARKMQTGSAFVRKSNRDGRDVIAAGLRRDWGAVGGANGPERGKHEPSPPGRELASGARGAHSRPA